MFQHDCVVFIDRKQREELGKLRVDNKIIEFVSDDIHFITDVNKLIEVRKEQDVVRISDDKSYYYFKFLKESPSQKWYSSKIHYECDEEAYKKFVKLIFSMMKSREISKSVKEKVIVKEVVLTPCRYCGELIPQRASSCPSCGGKQK